VADLVSHVETFKLTENGFRISIQLWSNYVEHFVKVLLESQVQSDLKLG